MDAGINYKLKATDKLLKKIHMTFWYVLQIEGLQRHFDDQVFMYGEQIIVNLVSHHVLCSSDLVVHMYL